MESIIFDGKMIKLSSLPKEKLKQILSKLNEEESEIKEEISGMLEDQT